MTEHRNEDEAPLPALQAEAAARYHTPPDHIPRDAMWAAIQAKRARASVRMSDADARPVADTPELTVTRTKRGAVWRMRWLAAATAAAILVGVVVTRSGTEITDAPTAVADSAQGSAAWKVAATEHFGLAESMLTTLSASPRSDGSAELSAWARDLLESTRLLMDSPAGRDPRRRALLEDLELVLVQLVQSGPATRTEARSVMDEVLSRSALLLTRIRTNIPAGVPALQH